MRTLLITRGPFPKPLPVFLMRKRSLQLLSRLRRFRSFPGFCAVWIVDANSRMLQSKHHPEFLEFQRLLPHRVSIQTGKSSLAVLSITSTTTASASARGSPEYDDCQETTDFFSCLSISKLCLKGCDRLSSVTESARNPCVRNRETFSGSRPASQCQCSCGSCGYQSTR